MLPGRCSGGGRVRICAVGALAKSKGFFANRFFLVCVTELHAFYMFANGLLRLFKISTFLSHDSQRILSTVSFQWHHLLLDRF